MIIYNINYPVKLSDCFEVKPDKDIWNGKYKEGKPEREKMSFNKLLIPTTDYAEKYCTYGLYLMFFIDFKKYYVGLACKFKKKPEGILKRLRKHRAKATATNTSDVTYTNDHNDGWKVFADERYNSYGINDQLQDCYLVTINVENHEELFDNNEKKKLAFIEKELSSIEHPKIQEIISLLPNSVTKSPQAKNWRSFNKKNKKKIIKHDHKFVLQRDTHQKKFL